MIDSTVSLSLIRATEKRFEAQRDEAIATLLVYFTNPTAIGEHPGFIDEIDKLLENAASAQEKLDTLQRYFRQVSPEQQQDEG